MRSSLLRMGMLLLPVVFFLSCTDEENLESEKVSFTFSFDPAESKAGRITPVDLPDGVSLLITLQRDNGEIILEQHQVQLQKEGGHYISSPIALTNGIYNITDFMVVDESQEVLYATPRKGSALATQIQQSLPVRFNSDQRPGTNVKLEVLDAKATAAKHFGYKSFKKKGESLKIQVFIPEANKLVATTAQALILNGDDTMKTYPLSPKMNTLTFNGEAGVTYTLVVVKDSYARFTDDFTVNDLKKKNPLKVELESALTLTAIPIQDQNYFGMQLDTWYAPHEFTVDWGDGTSEVWTSGMTVVVEHYYEAPGQYFVSITGHALDSVILVGNMHGAGDIGSVGLKHLVNLREFRMEWTDGPSTIDFSHNPLITEIRTYNAKVENLIIPDDAILYLLELIGATELTQASFDEVVNDLHNQVTNSPRTGDFLYYMPQNSDMPILEPSPESLVKLRELKNAYSWVVVPDPDL